MEDEVREGHPAEGDAEIGHVGEVRLGALPRPVDLREDHLPVGAVLGAPGGDVALERPQLRRLIAPGGPLAQQREERRRLQGGVARELLADPRPLVGEGVGAGQMGARLLQLAGQPAEALVLPRRADPHPGPRRRLLLGLAFGSFLDHSAHLRVGLHGMAPSSEAMLGQPRGGPLNQQFY